MGGKPTVAIIGGGIGGLAAALALQRRGIAAKVFERTPGLVEIGAGLNLSPNALKSFATSVSRQKRLQPGIRTNISTYGVGVAAGLSRETIAGVPLGRRLVQAISQFIEPTCRRFSLKPLRQVVATRLCLYRRRDAGLAGIRHFREWAESRS